MPPELLTRAQVARSGAAIEGVQERDGAIPWTVGGHTDVWNHVEAAMALLVAERHDAVDRAWSWVRRTQRRDGSWPLKTVGGVVEDASGETNMAAYVAVGVWHHWLVRRDESFVATLWPTVRRALDFACSLQLPVRRDRLVAGVVGSRPGRVNRDGLLTGSSSVHHALRAGLTLAEHLDDPQPEWERRPVASATRCASTATGSSTSRRSRWTGTTRCWAARSGGMRAASCIASRWHDFVVPGLGVRCVDTDPWVTGAESCELVLALDALGDRERAERLFADVQHLRDDDGCYWTGYVYPDEVHWPAEHTTFTAAAVVLAHDALTGRHRAQTWSGARGWSPTRSRRAGVRLRVSGRSAGHPDRGGAPGASHVADTSANRSGVQRPQVDARTAAGRRRPGRGRRRGWRAGRPAPRAASSAS